MAQGVVYGDYYLIGRLAQGGMAEVFLAKSLLEGASATQLLALKRTLSQYSGEEDFISMFTDEARIASGLKHPHICQIIDHGRLADQHFIVMEFIHGKDLKVVAHRARQRKELIPAPYTAYILARIGEALHAAHTKENSAGELEKIVHRDISPQNILISYDGIPKLIDFGIAKAKDRLAKTQAGIVKGKFAYMSPEQAIGSEVDFRTDIFALGVVLYELLVGELPFKGSSDFSTLKKIAKAEYNPPPTGRVPPRLMQVIERALTRSPDDRYDSAQTMADDLERYLVDENRSIRPGTISSYMRKLFRDDYIREMGRMKDYEELDLPRRTAAKAPEAGAISADHSDHRTTRRGSAVDLDDVEETAEIEEVTRVGTEAEEESTRITSSVELAAGFESVDGNADADERDEVTGLAQLLEPDADDLDFDTLDIEDEGEGPLDGDDFNEPTRNVPMGEFSFSESTAETAFSPDMVAEEILDVSERPTRDVAEAAAAAKPITGRRATAPPQVAVVEEPLILDDDDGLDGATLNLESEVDELLAREPVPLPAPEATPDRPATAPPGARPQSQRPSRRRTTDGSGKSVKDSGQARPRANTGRKSRTASGRRRKQGGLLSNGEVATLAAVGLLGVMFVFSTYYLVNNGVPEFASGLRPAIEKLTGKLPEHGQANTPSAPSPTTKKDARPTPGG